MSEAVNDGVSLYYERHGSGEPLLLITGLGGRGDAWSRQIPAFAAHFDVLTVDPRGCGRSSVPATPYDTEDMAADAVAVLDHAGVASAHVLGIGLGGMAAQQLALRWSGRVNTLVLFSTFARADAHARRLLETWRDLLPLVGWETLGRSISLWTLTPKMFEERPEEIRRLDDGFRHGQPSVDAYAAQVQALLGHDTEADLARITAPTLVALGAEDIETPIRFAHVLTDGIPNAELEILPGTGHRPHVETPDLFNNTVLAFLNRHSTLKDAADKDGRA